MVIKKISVLIIEDSVYSADLNVRELKRAGFEVTGRMVAGRSAMEAALVGEQWDVILCDNSMPGFDALRAIEIRNRLSPGVPFIIVSEDMNYEDMIKALERGCSAFLSKRNLSLLGKLVLNILEQAFEDKQYLGGRTMEVK